LPSFFHIPVKIIIIIINSTSSLTRRRLSDKLSTEERSFILNMERFVPIVHGVTAVFAVIELGLTAYRECAPSIPGPGQQV
jgi:hypothetical protein